ncbi:contractile injection system protein, VgrG/Pvc8 family [Clostridium sp.]|uniref:contractile injection system protein, VgrG/Pvc8 family n=1 Tax=Clostridium sp. TaxID=1506 RepID=UPI003464B98B
MTSNKVEAISYKDIRVKGYNLQSIIDLKIKTSINEHGTLELTGILKSGEEDKDIYLTGENKTIEVFYYEKDKAMTLFHGVVNHIEVEMENKVYILKIRANSMTYLMDIKKESRSFQNSSTTSHEILKTIMRGYSNSSYIFNIPNKPIKSLLIQYEETDWEFIKRIASKYNEGILQCSNNEGIQYVIGVSNEGKKINTDIIQYEVFKDLESYYYMKKNYLKNAREEEFITYKIYSYQVLKLGDITPFLGQDFYVYETTYEIKDSILQNTYNLRVKNGLRQKSIFNTNIIGSSINGKIIGVSGDKVKVHLEIDSSQSQGGAYSFKYSTMSASTDGSGWYCMPEIGDSVRVYFPTKNEGDSFAVSAVSSYDGTSGGGEDRMSSPDNKYLRTAHDKQVKLTPGGIFISCDSGQADMSLTNDGTLSIVSQNNVNVNAKESIKIDAQKSFFISAKKGVTLKCDKNGGLDFDEEGQIKEMGTKVNNN